ncbi:uncharacterized protein LOC127465894 [Manacus candei]|uniref:uncharacterized protein LOC127465894 n=1 Tax=Manacus candei TaxID=415023 RepID=UPI002225D096|nr:uncharacterized protein LOC127465894 [Manacus candei]
MGESLERGKEEEKPPDFSLSPRQPMNCLPGNGSPLRKSRNSWCRLGRWIGRPSPSVPAQPLGPCPVVALPALQWDVAWKLHRAEPRDLKGPTKGGEERRKKGSEAAAKQHQVPVSAAARSPLKWQLQLFLWCGPVEFQENGQGQNLQKSPGLRWLSVGVTQSGCPCPRDSPQSCLWHPLLKGGSCPEPAASSWRIQEDAALFSWEGITPVSSKVPTEVAAAVVPVVWASGVPGEWKRAEPVGITPDVGSIWDVNARTCQEKQWPR